MFQLHRIIAGPIQTNAYLVGAENSDSFLLVDAPPGSYEPVMDILKRTGRKLEALLITHPHFDHTLDIPRFMEHGPFLAAHPDAKRGLRNPDTLGMFETSEDDWNSISIEKTVMEGDRFECAGVVIDVFEVPGHSPASVAYHIAEHSVCFVGDLIFKASVGRTDLPGGDFNQLSESIRTKIYKLNDETILYSGHGEATNVGMEKKMNPYVSVLN